MSDIDLKAIRARAEAATEGPWRAAWPKGLHPWEVCISADVPLVELAHGEQGIADAEFIAHAREDIPALLAEIERLSAEMDEQDSALSSLHTDLDFQTKAAFDNQAEANRLSAELDERNAEEIGRAFADEPAGEAS